MENEYRSWWIVVSVVMTVSFWGMSIMMNIDDVDDHISEIEENVFFVDEKYMKNTVDINNETYILININNTNW